MPAASAWHARFLQQSRWTSHVRRFLFEQYDLRAPQRGLEVGIGTGAIAAGVRDLGDFVLHGADLRRDFLRFAAVQAPGLRLAQVDGMALPYANASFDFTYCHYLILWLPDPLPVLREMRRVTRPGGPVLALAEPDYAARIDWPPPLQELGKLQAAALARLGARPSAGRELAGLFHRAGLRQVTAGLLGGQWGAPPDPGFIASEWETLAADLGDALPPGELERLRQVDEQAWLRGERILYVPTFYASGLV